MIKTTLRLVNVKNCLNYKKRLVTIVMAIVMEIVMAILIVGTQTIRMVGTEGLIIIIGTQVNPREEEEEDIKETKGLKYSLVVFLMKCMKMNFNNSLINRESLLID